MFDPESAIGVEVRLWEFDPGELLVLVSTFILLLTVLLFYQRDTHLKFSRSDPILTLAIGCGPALLLGCLALGGLGGLIVFATIFSLIVFRKKLRYRMVLLAILSTGLAVTIFIFSWDVHQQYLLSCLDAEDDSVAAWAYHDLAHDDANNPWLLTVMNDPRETQYVRFYIGQILAERLSQLPPQERTQVLNQLDSVNKMDAFLPFKWTEENRNAQRIAYPASPRSIVRQLIALN